MHMTWPVQAFDVVDNVIDRHDDGEREQRGQNGRAGWSDLEQTCCGSAVWRFYAHTTET